jgi:hypothetical protein
VSACRERLDAMLEADPHELAGRGESALAVHVRSCSQCRNAAQAILDATARLDAVLDAPGRAPDIEAILTRARLRVTPSPPAKRRHSAKRWVALAAAGIAALMVMGRREPAPPESTPARLVTPPLVEVADDANVAVLPTRDPDITILWFFQGG